MRSLTTQIVQHDCLKTFCNQFERKKHLGVKMYKILELLQQKHDDWNNQFHQSKTLKSQVKLLAK